jgi:long-chain acyl-CoA synthetase
MENTLPKLLLQNYQKWGDTRVAMRHKEFGFWREYTWKDYYEKVKYFSLGLMSLGFERGDHVSIIGDNEPEWFWAELAVQAGGGAVSGIFSDCFPPEVKYIIENSDGKFVVVQDQEQIDKLLQVNDELPLVQKVIYWNESGLRHYDDSTLMSFQEVLKLGREYEERYPGIFEQEVAQGKGEDIAFIAYTSGTTSQPKGAILDYDYLLKGAVRTFDFNPIYENDEYLSFTLPGWSIEQLYGLMAGLLKGQIMNFPEKQETVAENIREIAPNTILYPSRLWEDVASTVQVKTSDSNFIYRFLYNLFLPVGYKIGDLSLTGRRPNLFWRFLFGLAELVVFRPLRDKHGLTRVRTPYTAGALLGPNVMRFFRAIGLNLRQVYGTTEGGTTAHVGNDIKFETVGIPQVGEIIRISDEDEILVDKDSVFVGYYKNPEATEKKFSGGWFHTGDAGHFNDDGHLIFIDRMDDMKQLANGVKYSPQYIESRLKFSPYIKDAFVAGGGERDYIGAVININFANVSDWAERRKIPYTTFVDLSQRQEVCGLIKKEMEKMNRNLPEGAGVKAFVNLHKEFDADEAELTRTRKIRRTFIEDRYKDLVEAIYGEREELVMEASVIYRDGRTGVVSTKIKVNRLD